MYIKNILSNLEQIPNTVQPNLNSPSAEHCLMLPSEVMKELFFRDRHK